MINIRKATANDWPAIWRIIQPVFSAGESYAYSPDISEQSARHIWLEVPMETYVAVNEANVILGTYYIKPNQPCLGSHVCNCGYIVADAAKGKGLASQMCIHSQQAAIKQGFCAMQYNLVATTNEGAIHVWKKHGFEIVGILPIAFNHKRLGLVDALVMYKLLEMK